MQKEIFELVCVKRLDYWFGNNWMKHWGDLQHVFHLASTFILSVTLQCYAVLCKCILMGVHLHVWVAWNQNQNKEAFTPAAPSFLDVMTFICFFSLLLVFEPQSSMSLWPVRVLMSVFWLWGREVSIGNAAGIIFTAVYIAQVSAAWEVGGEQALQNPDWKFGNWGTGQNISPGCGCLWDSASLVTVQVCVHPAAYRHSTLCRSHLNSSREGWKSQKKIWLECLCSCRTHTNHFPLCVNLLFSPLKQTLPL